MAHLNLSPSGSIWVLAIVFRFCQGGYRGLQFNLTGGGSQLVAVVLGWKNWQSN